MTDNHSTPRACLCGCGGAPVLGFFMRGHNRAGQSVSLRRPDPGDAPGCECGCGAMTTLRDGRWQRFVTGHNSKAYKRRGPDNSNWKGVHARSGPGTLNVYVSIWNPAHHRADRKGYVLRSILVAEASLGRAVMPGENVHHVNRDKRDDRPENLLVLTTAEHVALHHREDHRRVVRGESVRSSKLTTADVRTIRCDCRGLTNTELAKRFGVHRGTIGKVLRGERWAHVNEVET